MPMLAERRRKTKWTNPGRQALWKRDSGDAAFGREMMEKMGWKVGQGLGANEQGIKEPLKISFKNDNKGMGFKDNDNEWIQQQSEFDEFLSKLSSEKKELSKDSQINTVQSLEERSRLSKARVHYHKFTRGKDLTKYSKKDLECILGRNEKESSEISGNTESCNENIGNEDKSFITAGSMVDYFAQKIQSKKKKEDDSLNVMDSEVGESLLGSRSKDEIEENVVESTIELDEKRKKKSKKKKEKDGGGCNEGPCDERDINNSDNKMKSSSEGGKKSKKTKIVQECDQLDESMGCENETTETELTGIPKEEKPENVVQSTMELDEKRKKKSKKKKEKDEGGCNERPCDERDINNSDHKMKSSSEGGKKSKKTKIVQEHDQLNSLDGSMGCENVTTETELIEIPKEQKPENVVQSTMELDEKKKKKSKKKKEKDQGGCNEEPCDENSDNKMKSSSEGGKKSKKTKIVQEHDQLNSLDGSRSCENETTETEVIGVPKEEEPENVVESTIELDEKRKKKSKKKKEKDEGGCNEGPCDERDINNSDYKMKCSSEGGKKSKKIKIVQEHDRLDGSMGCENETTETELMGVQKEEEEGEEENVNNTNLEGGGVQDEKLKKKKKKRKKEENPIEQFDPENVEALNVFENRDGECEETQEKANSLTSAEGARKKKKASKRDRRVIIDDNDEGGPTEKIKKKKKCLEAENPFNYEDCGTKENDVNAVSHTETDFKREKEKGKTKCESAVGNKQETKKDEREGIAGEDPLLYKVELLKKENSLKGTSRNKLLNLICSTNIEQFSGSNLGRLSGYGVVSHR